MGRSKGNRDKKLQDILMPTFDEPETSTGDSPNMEEIKNLALSLVRGDHRGRTKSQLAQRITNADSRIPLPMAYQGINELVGDELLKEGRDKTYHLTHEGRNYKPK